MKTLQVGDAGQPVKRLQRKLLSLGFPPGTIDGEFGYGTEAAVLAFQRSNGLLADGIAGHERSLPWAFPMMTPFQPPSRCLRSPSSHRCFPSRR